MSDHGPRIVVCGNAGDSRSLLEERFLAIGKTAKGPGLSVCMMDHHSLINAQRFESETPRDKIEFKDLKLPCSPKPYAAEWSKQGSTPRFTNRYFDHHKTKSRRKMAKTSRRKNR